MFVNGSEKKIMTSKVAAGEVATLRDVFMMVYEYVSCMKIRKHG